MTRSEKPTRRRRGERTKAAGGRHISDIVALIQELTSVTIGSDSQASLFGSAFMTLSRSLPFDVAVCVMLEQNLDLYISTRTDGESLVTDTLIGRLRQTLQELIPISFETTDVIVKSERHDLPSRDEGDSELRHELSVLMQIANRAAGALVLYRSDPPFDPEHRQLFEIFSTQVSLLLGNLQSREQIMNLADTDELTGIWNKRYFRRHLPQEIERSRIYHLPLAVLIVDVDDFKQINDTFGHAAGDVVLSEMCGAVRETLRGPDLFARFGGDEFAIVLPHTDLAGAAAVAERILQKVRGLTIPTDEQGAIRCAVSVGAAELRPDDVTFDDVVRRADDHLYTAKRAGKNRVVAE